MSEDLIGNYYAGQWHMPSGLDTLDIIDPAAQTILGRTILSSAAEVDAAVCAARDAYPEWRRTPAGTRVQYLYALKGKLEEHKDEIARLITLECGKTLDESLGELQRAIENVEVACGVPTLMQGDISEDIAHGIDETMLRQPLGVCAAITPFNFPGMIPFWFFPYAIACGNTYLVKPSERVPLTMRRVFELIDEIGLPKGVLNLVNGGRETVEVILDHPDVRAISFVGSTAVAKAVYSRAAANGKRAQCQGGAKNPVVLLPDADMETATRIIADSAFGCAGQRCLAASLIITVGEAGSMFREHISQAAANRTIGHGLDPQTQMGPVITPAAKTRIEGLIDKAVDEGASILVDGRGRTASGYERGNFLGATVLEGLPPYGEIAQTEIFGPVLGLIQVETLDEAIQWINKSRYGNSACLFTNSGPAARKFRYEAEAGNIGINIGVAAPIANFPFSGWKDSFFGDLHGQGKHGVEFFTQTKVIIERWPKEWSRKF